MAQDLKLFPAGLSGVVQVPTSKSLAHRAVLCAALAKGGVSKVNRIALSDDLAATVRGASALGAHIEQKDDTLHVTGAPHPKDTVFIDCNESGSTLRFLIPIALALGCSARFVGRGNLGKRPLNAYFDILREQGILFEAATDGRLDLTVRGQLHAGRFVLPGNVSSQYITGLLLALPLLDEPSEIVVEGPLESKGYLDLTLQVMRAFGAQMSCEEYRVFRVSPGGYRAKEYTVEGDFSQAAFFLAGGALAGIRSVMTHTPSGRLSIAGLSPESMQGDRVVCNILQDMGARVEWDESGRLQCTAERLQGCVIDAAQCPDIIPMMAAVACACEGESRIVNAGRLRIKECDRLAAVARELLALGGAIREEGDSLYIAGRPTKGWPLQGGSAVWSHGDHRMAMTLSVAAAVCEAPFVLRDFPCVSKSYPDFFDDYRRLGGVCYELDLGNQM